MSSISNYLSEVRAELGKVVWPSRKDTVRYTIMVVIFSLVVAAILGAADFGLLKGIQSLLSK
jgi:preprotein translocase subunit SecE